MAVENRVHDAFLTSMDNVVIPPVAMAVRSITVSSRREPSGMVQNPDQREFTVKTANTPLVPTTIRVDLNVDQDRNDDTRFVENFEDGDFSALRPNYDRIAHAH